MAERLLIYSAVDVGSIPLGGPIEPFLVPATTGVANSVICVNMSMLLIGKSSPCGSIEVALSLSVWSFTICLTSYNRK